MMFGRCGTGGGVGGWGGTVAVDLGDGVGRAGERERGDGRLSAVDVGGSE